MKVSDKRAQEMRREWSRKIAGPSRAYADALDLLDDRDELIRVREGLVDQITEQAKRIKQLEARQEQHTWCYACDGYVKLPHVFEGHAVATSTEEA